MSSSTTSVATSGCATPTAAFRIQPLNFPNTYLTTVNGGSIPTSDHNSMTTTSNLVNATTFNPVSDGEITVNQASGGANALYSDQQQPYGGNGPIFLDTVNSLQNTQSYGAGVVTRQPITFCLQADNTFLVSNPAVPGANVVAICGGLISLYTQANYTAQGSSCSRLKLTVAY